MRAAYTGANSSQAKKLTGILWRTRHHRISEGRHAQPSQYRQQRIARRPVHGIEQPRSVVHPGNFLPLLRNGAGHDGLRDKRRNHRATRSVLQSAGYSRGSPAEYSTALHGVPTMFIAELDHPEFSRFDLSTLRTGIIVGSPCPIEVMKRAVQLMHLREMTIAYGLTEASLVITETAVDDPLELRVTTVGRPCPTPRSRLWMF